MKFRERVGYSTDWKLYVTDGTPLTPDELSVLRSGGKVDRVKRTQSRHNILPDVSRTRLCYTLAGSAATLDDTKVKYQELGTGTTAPANADTGLETPTGATRKAISSIASGTYQLNITSFWAATEATGTWKEYGTFIGGTIASNSGVLFNRIAIDITISASESLTIDGTITFTNA